MADTPLDFEAELAVCEAAKKARLYCDVRTGADTKEDNAMVEQILVALPEALRRLVRLREILEVGGICPEGWKEIRSLLNIEEA